MTMAENLAARFESLLGHARIFSPETEGAKYSIAGRTPAAIARPQNAEEVAEIVRIAASEKLAVVCSGSRSKLEIGMPPQCYDLALDLTELRTIAHYDPADLTLSVDAGVRLSDLSKVLRAQGQFLPLAVPCFARATIGGTISSGVDSLLRLQYGTARDFLIGAEFVDGKGQRCKSGGRVVKNVTGYDIHKLLIGSLGTLAAITRLNFRTFPLPERRRGALLSFATAETALAFRKNLLASGLPFESVELFDPEFAALLADELRDRSSAFAELLLPRCWFVYSAFAGNEAVVDRMRREVKERATRCDAKADEHLESNSNDLLNDALREAFDWMRHGSRCLALLRVTQNQFTASELERLLQAVKTPSANKSLLLGGRGNALIALLANEEDSTARSSAERDITEFMAHGDGRENASMLLHVADSLRARRNVWGSARPDLPLMKRVKIAFDPQGVFASGRFTGGI
jgi:glycolate oxidase FAD binding subunit